MKALAFSFSLLACLIAFGQQDTSKTITQKLDEFLKSAVTANKFNGTAIVAQKGQILLSKGYGFKNVAANTLNDTNSIFQIGSITKSFTAIVILQLQEQGKLSVQDKLSKFFPDYPQGDKITIQHLLTHTSGIYNYTDDIDENDTAIVCYPVSKDRVLAVFKNKQPAFRAGKYFQYSNSGYFLLGMIIEKITGMPYEAVVRQIIFNQLQMNHSGFDFKNMADANKTQGYVLLTKDTIKVNYTIDSTVYFSAGAMYSTTNDMYKWAQAISSHSLLTELSWKQAFTPVKGNYGYGFKIKNTIYGKKYISHDGGLLGYTSDFIYFPDDDVTIILLNNTGNYGISLSPVSMWVSAIVFNKPYSNWMTTSANFTDNDSALNKYCGTYKSDTKGKIFIASKNGRLIAMENSEQSLPEKITLVSETKLYFNDYNISADLIKDSNDKILKLIVHQIGVDIEFTKIN